MASDVVGAAKIKLEFDDKSLDASTKTADKSLSAWTVAAGNMITKAFDKTISTVSSMLQSGINFGDAMAKVKAISGAIGDEFDSLHDKAIDLGNTTRYSATEVADGFSYMAMAGWKTEDMLSGIAPILNLAAASGSDLATTSDIVTDALTAMGYQASDAGRLADVMAAASSNASTDVIKLGNSFKYVAPLAGAMGYNMEDLGVALGVMANGGVKAEQAGTQLRNIITRLVDPSAEAAKALNALGISATNTDGTVRPLSSLLADLRKKFANLTEAEKTQTASNIAGTESMAGLLAIINASDEDFAAMTDAINNSSGSAENMASIMNDTLGGQLDGAKARFEALSIKLTETFAPALSAILDGAMAFVDFLTQNQGIVIGVIGGITAGLIAYKVVALATSQINPLWWVPLAITLVGALVGWVVQNFGEIGEFIGGICQGIGDFFSSTFGWMGDIIGEFGAFFGEIFQGIGDFFNNTFGWIFDIFDGIFSAMSDIVGVFGDFFGGIFQGIGEFFDNTFGWIFDIFGAIFGDMTGGVGDFGTFFNNTFQGIGEFFDNTFGWIFDIFSTIFGWMGDTLGWFGEFFGGVFQGIGDFFSNTFGWIFDVFSNVFSGISNALSGFADFFRGIFQGISSFVQGIIDGISGFFQGLWDGIQSGFQAISDFITTIFETIGNVIKAPFNGIISAINGVIDMINSIKIPDWVPLIGGAGFNIPKIPLLAEGGLASSATMAIFGEAGTEAVLPLKNNTDNWSGLLAETLMDSMEERGGAGGGKEVVINNYNTVSNDYDAQKLSDLMVRQIRRAA